MSARRRRSLTATGVALAGALLALIGTQGPYEVHGREGRPFRFEGGAARLPAERHEQSFADKRLAALAAYPLAVALLIGLSFLLRHRRMRAGVLVLAATVAAMGVLAGAVVNTTTIREAGTFSEAGWGRIAFIVGLCVAAVGSVVALVVGTPPPWELPTLEAQEKND